MSDCYFIGVDVGTGSVRAGLVSCNGKVIKNHVKSIKTWNPKPDYYEQSSDDIWKATVECIKAVIKNVDSKNIRGIGFDATCSLVCLDRGGNPLTISPTGSNQHNIILWMDHRANQEADKINQKNHQILKYVGGKISVEMEIPKLMWLKNNLPETWHKSGLFFDLPDFLTWKATGSETRSLCSLVCKWNYEVSNDGVQGWNLSYFQDLGLGDLQETNWRKIGSDVQSPGSTIRNGLSKEAAQLFGLLPGTPVGVSMIDAHAGGLGLIGCTIDNLSNQFSTRLNLICGTSTCHMTVSEKPIFCPGVWGPYFSAMVPGMWLNEGGQSATGKLIDHIIETHPAYPEVMRKIGESKHVQIFLTEKLNELADMQNVSSTCFLTENLHVWPDFHGNRSPLADPTLKGSINGLTLTKNEEDLAILYLATIQALAYGTRHILESLINSGHKNIKSILICGGLSKNALFVQTQADVLNIPVVCPDEQESVLLGAAILGASASGYYGNVENAIHRMGGSGSVVNPDEKVTQYHDKKYEVFLSMVEDQIKYRNIMNSTHTS